MLRILNSNPGKLAVLLGNLSQYVELKGGDALVDQEAEVSRAIFERLLIQGHTAYKVDEEGKSDGPIREFDSLAQKIVLVGPVAGG